MTRKTMAAERRFLMAVLIVCTVLPTALTLLDLMVLKQGGKLALGILFITPVTALVMLGLAVKALLQDRFVLFVTLFFAAGASVLVPLFLMLSRARHIDLWSPVF